VIEVVMMWMIITTDLSDYERIPLERSAVMSSRVTNGDATHSAIAQQSDLTRNTVAEQEDGKLMEDDDVAQYLSDSSDRFQSYIARMKGRREESSVHLHMTQLSSSVKQQSVDVAVKDKDSAAYHDKYNMYVDSVHSSNSDEDSNIPYY